MTTTVSRKKNPLSLKEVRFVIHLAQMDLTANSNQNKKKICHEIDAPSDAKIK